MARVPVFIEAWEGQQLANLRVCRLITTALFNRGVEPLPFATSKKQLREVGASLADHGSRPAIYVVNTFEAAELLQTVDRAIGETPLLLLHRELYSFNLVHRKALLDTTRLLDGLRPRLTALCGYGPMNSHLVADRVAAALQEFLADGDFAHVEGLSSRLAISSGLES
jgi:hypothetical protein